MWAGKVCAWLCCLFILCYVSMFTFWVVRAVALHHLVVGGFISFLFPGYLLLTSNSCLLLCHIYFNFFLLHVKSRNKVSSHQYVVNGNGVLPKHFGEKRKQSTLRWNEHLV